MRDLFTTPAFDRDIRAAPSLIVDDIRTLTPELLRDPISPQLGVKKLIGVQGSLYRIRLNEYRLVYSYTLKTVVFRRLAHRSTVYRGL